MNRKLLVLSVSVFSLLVVGSVPAEIDCSNIEPSTGPVPRELAEACWSSSGGGAPVGVDFPSYKAFGPEMVNLDLVDVTLNAPEVLNAIGPVTAPEFIGACEFAYQFNILYCTDVAHSWFILDTATGGRTDIGPLTPPPPGAETVTGLAFDAIGGMMYICSTDLVTSSLMQVLPSGATTPVGTITNSPGIIACAADSDGNLWGYDMMTDMLLSIDKATGAGTEIGSIGFDAAFGQGMDFDDTDGTCYMFAFNTSAGRAELRTCDTTSGASNLIGVLGETTPGGLTQISGAGIATSPWMITPNVFAVDDNTDSFYGLEPLVSGVMLIGPANENLSYSGLAWDSWNKTMYVSDVQIAGGGYGLGRVNLYSGKVTPIGAHVNSLDIMGLAFDSTNDVLYGADIDCDGLATIDRQTGVSTCIGPWGTTLEIRGLGYSHLSDTLFGIDLDNLFTLNRNTGAATVVGPHGIPFDGAYIGLDFDESFGVLFAAGSGDPNLWVIDESSGVGNVLGPHGLTGLSGLASTLTPGAPCGIFCDGFESGDTTQWN